MWGRLEDLGFYVHFSPVVGHKGTCLRFSIYIIYTVHLAFDMVYVYMYVPTDLKP